MLINLLAAVNYFNEWRRLMSERFLRSNVASQKNLSDKALFQNQLNLTFFVFKMGLSSTSPSICKDRM